MSDPFQIVGTTIAEKYRVDGLLGEGGYGVVYAGFHLLLGTKVAIKLLKPVSGMGQGEQVATQQFLREARILFSLSHPAIVRMYDVGELPTRVGNVPYVVLELLDGVGLDAELAQRKQQGRGGFSPSELTSVFEPVLEALSFAHKHGIVHRDLKPSNVMLVRTPSGGLTSKVLDFGTARASAQEVSMGTTGFTPRYAAPEQWDPAFGTTGPATDIFSLGLILAEAATLEPALNFSSVTQVLAAAVSPNHLVRVRGIRPDLPDAFEEVVLKATSRPMHARFVSTDAMRDALHASLSGGAATMGAPSFAAAPPGPSPYAPGPSPYAPSSAFYPDPRFDRTGPPMWTGAQPVATGSGGVLIAVIGGIVALLGVGGVVGMLLLRSSPEPMPSTVATTATAVTPTETAEPAPTEAPIAPPTHTGTGRTTRPSSTSTTASTGTTGTPGIVTGTPTATTPPSGPIPTISLSLSKPHPSAGERFDVRFAPALPAVGERYWITVISADSADTGWGDWGYVNVGQSSQVVTAPSTPGTYEVRLHDSYPRFTTHVNSRTRFVVDGAAH